MKYLQNWLTSTAIVAAIFIAILGVLMSDAAQPTLAAQKLDQLKVQLPTTGLVAYYPFNGNANDESGNGNNGTVVGATLTTDRFGSSNSAYSFDGVNDYIDLGSQQIINDSAAFSVSFWANVAGGSNDGPTMIRLKGNTSEFQYTFRTNIGGVIYFGFRQFLGIVSNESQYNLNNLKDEWHHHAIVYSGGNKNSLGSYKVYIDGVSISLASFNTVGGSTNENALGRDFLNLHYLEGILDDVRIYNRALTQTEILTLSDSFLVAFYPFNGNANDESGNGNNATVVGASLTTDRFGNPNSAYSFDGVNDYITRPFSATSGLHPTEQAVAISAWFNTSASSPQQQTIIATHHAGLGDGYWVGIDSGNSSRIRCFFSINNSDVPVFSIGSVNDGLWHHLVCLWKDDMVYLYLDDVLQDTNSAVGVVAYPNQASFKIGHTDSSTPASWYYFNGLLDDVRIDRRVPVKIYLPIVLKNR